MPQLDFHEALSTPEEKLFLPPTALASATSAPVDKKTSLFPRGVGLSRSTWTNIVFVVIASVGGLVCAFYFFNGAELLRAAASWPAEFLYPRPVSADPTAAREQPNPIDQFSNGTENTESTTASNKGDAKSPFQQDFWVPDLTQPTTTIGTTSPAPPPPVIPPESGIVIVPPAPPATSPLNDLNTVVNGEDALVQSLYQTANQTVTSIVPKKIVTATARSTINSTRRKVSSTRQKLPLRATATSANSTARSISQTLQQMTTTQVQAPVIQNQTMFGGGMLGSGSAAGGVGSVGGVGGVGSAGGVGSVGSVGGVGGVGSVGGAGGVGGLGSGLGGIGIGGLGSGLGGLGGLGGHH
jgi:hypothetical protein